MSPRNQKDRKDIHDSTTEFFLKVVQKEKAKSTKENTTKENMSNTKTKTFDTVGRFYNYINKTLDRILSSKASIMILSFAMAGVLFYSISGKDIITSPTSGSKLENVPVLVENLDDSLELNGLPEKVNIGLIGPSLDIYKTNFTKDYEVYVDLKDLTEGEYTLNLKSRNFPDTLEVMLVPGTVKVELLPKVTQEFDLGYQFINEDELDNKYSVSVEQLDLKSVSLRASENTLAKVDKVVACIDVSGKTEAFEQNAEIKAYDINGKEMNVEISAKKTHVQCNVASYSKTVAIKANFIGDIPTGYQIANYSLSQSEVTIYGVEDLIKDISVVSVDVDVSDMKSTSTINASLKKENGINKFSTTDISVTVEIEKVITKKFDKIQIKVLNNEKNYKVSFAGEGGYASVSVTGTEAKIAALTADNIQATIDVDTLKIGTRKADVKVAVDDEKLKIELLSSSRVTINIERN